MEFYLSYSSENIFGGTKAIICILSACHNSIALTDDVARYVDVANICKILAYFERPKFINLTSDKAYNLKKYKKQHNIFTNIHQFPHGIIASLSASTYN